MLRGTQTEATAEAFAMRSPSALARRCFPTAEGLTMEWMGNARKS